MKLLKILFLINVLFCLIVQNAFSQSCEIPNEITFKGKTRALKFVNDVSVTIKNTQSPPPEKWEGTYDGTSAEGEPYQGVLKITVVDKVKCKLAGKWSDKFGSGRFVFNLASDLSGFKGKFGAGDDLSYEWTGEVNKLDSAPASPPKTPAVPSPGAGAT